MHRDFYYKKNDNYQFGNQHIPLLRIWLALQTVVDVLDRHRQTKLMLTLLLRALKRHSYLKNFITVQRKTKSVPKSLPPTPGTATKNLTASLCPWKLNWACAIVQYGTKLPGTFCTRTLVPGRLPKRGRTASLTTESLSFNGTDIITPLLVPIHKRFDDISKLLIRTNEKPTFPVPETEERFI